MAQAARARTATQYGLFRTPAIGRASWPQEWVIRTTPTISGSEFVRLFVRPDLNSKFRPPIFSKET